MRKRRTGSGGTPATPVPIILLSANTILENAANNTVIGVLSVANGSGSYTFTITADPDSKFNISGANLRKNAAMDYEAATSHSVTVHADNGVGGTADRTFSITVLNVLEVTLNDLTLDTSTVLEGTGSGVLVGSLQSTSAGSTLSLVDSAGSRFQLSGTDILTGSVATNYATATSHNITVRETHSDGANSPHDSVITITVTQASGGTTDYTTTFIEMGQI